MLFGRDGSREKPRNVSYFCCSFSLLSNLIIISQHPTWSCHDNINLMRYHDKTKLSFLTPWMNSAVVSREAVVVAQLTTGVRRAERSAQRQQLFMDRCIRAAVPSNATSWQLKTTWTCCQCWSMGISIMISIKLYPITDLFYKYKILASCLCWQEFPAMGTCSMFHVTTLSSGQNIGF